MNNQQFKNWKQSNKPLIMGVLNVTPDSFSNDGYHLNIERAYARARTMLAEGADILDIGGESSRPGATIVSCDDELARVIPIIERIRASHDDCISIDTSKAAVMHAAVAAGASFINDINALRSDGALEVAASLDVPICLMHMNGTPNSMQNNPQYRLSIVDEINQFFCQRIDACEAAGINRHRLILDPGFGFGKSVAHNLSLMKGLMTFQQHGLPVLLGVSRKNTLGAVLNTTIMDRLPGALAAAVFAVLHGVRIIRTHDVRETHQALQMVSAVMHAD